MDRVDNVLSLSETEDADDKEDDGGPQSKYEFVSFPVTEETTVEAIFTGSRNTSLINWR